MNRLPAKASLALLLVLTLLMLGARFWRLDESPPGFSVDEVIAAGTVACFAQTGESIFGDPHPLFFSAQVGSPLSPPFVYLGAGWISVLGGSISSFRGFVALFGALACVGAAAGAYQLRGRRAALMALAVGAMSPWAFQFSRIAWDAALAPAFAVFGVVASVRRGRGWAVAGGGLLAASAYTYPPLRVHAPLILLGLVFVLVRRNDWRAAGILAASAAVMSLPLAWFLLSGELMGRYTEIGVFSGSYPDRSVPWYRLPKIILGNYAEHLSLRFLFISGDSNPRHSTQRFREFGWLDIMAVFCGIVVLLLQCRRVHRKQMPLGGLGLYAWCAATGFIPAALTWESLPHALRSVSVWPFWAILAGCLLAAVVDAYPWTDVAVAVTALAFSIAFATIYFEVYPRTVAHHFDIDHKELAERSRATGDWTAYLDAARSRPAASFYYPIQYGGMNCRDVRSWLRHH